MTKIKARQFNLDGYPSGSWLYAYGLLASRESKYFSDMDWQQLFSAGSKEAFLNLIHDKNYHGSSLEEALYESEIEDLILVKSAVPDYRFLKFFLTKKDGHNLKVLLRAQLTNKTGIILEEIEHLLLGPYLIRPSKILTEIEKSISDQDLIDDLPASSIEECGLPLWIWKVIVESVKDYFKYYSIPRVDQLVDRALYDELYRQAKELKSDWLLAFLKEEIDLKNLELLFRFHSLHLDKNFFEFSLLQNGSLHNNEWLDLFDLTDETLEISLADSKFSDFAQFAKNYNELGAASSFTQKVDTNLIHRLKETKNFEPGPERVMAYLFIRNLERKIIRIARACVINDFSEKRVSQLIRPGYK